MSRVCSFLKEHERLPNLTSELIAQSSGTKKRHLGVVPGGLDIRIPRISAKRKDVQIRSLDLDVQSALLIHIPDC
jgi:hypothetical protein